MADSRSIIALTAICLLAPAGCTEFSHFGQVSNRMTSAPVNDVRIEQQQSDGVWKTIGHSDGKGAWNIFKAQIKGGGRVRLSKPGYATIVMDESDFLSQNVIMMAPTSQDNWGDGVSDLR